MDFQFYFSRFTRLFPYFLIIFLLCTIAGLSVAVLLPPQYIARAKLLLESEQIPGDLASSTVQIPAREQLQIIQQRILTRGTLLEMANRLGVYDDYVGRQELNPDEIVRDMRDRIVIDLSGSFFRGAGTGNGVSSLVLVSFTAPNAELTATVTNEIVTKILNENVEMRTISSSQTLAFFEDEVERLDRELNEAGVAISSFRAENHDALPGDLENKRNELVSIQEKLLLNSRQITSTKNNREKLVSLYERTGIFSQGPTSSEHALLLNRKAELGALVLVLAPENPRIKILKAQIKQLEEQLLALEETSASKIAYNAELYKLDSTLQLAKEDREKLLKEMAYLRNKIVETPRNGIALDSLEREYRHIQGRYEQASAARARAQTGDLIESLSKGGRITVIEQAVVPFEPESPNRPLVASFGAIGGIFLGVAFLFLIEVMTGTARRPVDIIEGLGITPFATLPLILTQGDIRRRRLITTSLSFLILVALPFSLWGLHIYYLPLDKVFETVTERLAIG